MAQLDFVGGLEIPAAHPRELARWYSERFGLLMGVELNGAIYGGFRSSAGAFHFGLVPRRGLRRGAVGGVAITFHVDNFDRYVAELRERGLEPVGEAHDEDGHFASYRDPEGNQLTIWHE